LTNLDGNSNNITQFAQGVDVQNLVNSIWPLLICACVKKTRFRVDFFG